VINESLFLTFQKSRNINFIILNGNYPDLNIQSEPFDEAGAMNQLLKPHIPEESGILVSW
jgi:hypothetical protein